MAGEASGSGDVGSKTQVKPMLLPALTLVFVDAVSVHLTQQQLAFAMAEKHMAAPSEHQILAAVVAHMEQDVRGRDGAGSADVADVVAGALPAGLSKKQRKRLRILDVSNLSSSSTSDPISVLTHDEVTAQVFDIAAAAYSKSCGCTNSPPGTSTGTVATSDRCEDGEAEEEDAGEEEIDAHVLVLCRPQLQWQEDDLGRVDAVTSMWCTQTKIKASKKGKKEKKQKSGSSKGDDASLKLRRFYSRGKLSSVRIYPGLAVTALQHFAYHGRLMPAIEQSLKI